MNLSMKKYLLLITALSSAVFAILVLTPAASFLAASITQGYRADSTLAIGTVVSIKRADNTGVEESTTENEGLLVGVVADSLASSIDLLPKASKVTVSNEGQASILVTDYSGTIKTGNRLIISPVAGIAMKDTARATNAKYLGIASEDFSSSSAQAKSISITNEKGVKKTYAAGLITATIQISTRDNSGLDTGNYLTDVGSKIAGRPISLVQALAAAVVFTGAIILTGLIIYSSLRGSMIALGRNPLAKSSVLQGLSRIVALAIIILSVGVALSYIILLF